MYSRKFTGRAVPPNYGGVMYQQNKENSSVQKEQEEYPASREDFEEGSFENREVSENEKDYAPSFSGEMGEEHGENGNNALFSFKKKNFSMEDLILGGLLFLLLNDDKKEKDSTLFLILGLLLL